MVANERKSGESTISFQNEPTQSHISLNFSKVGV